MEQIENIKLSLWVGTKHLSCINSYYIQVEYSATSAYDLNLQLKMHLSTCEGFVCIQAVQLVYLTYMKCEC